MAATRRRPLTRSEIMRRVKCKDSVAERSIRRALHREGLRFHLHRRIEGITVDIAFPSCKVAILVDGCFWHGCPEHATYPKTNQAYWLPKLAENRTRDARQTKALRGAGWQLFRIWEHDCIPPAPRVLRRVISACRSKVPI